jgi:hypothetical protein
LESPVPDGRGFHHQHRQLNPPIPPFPCSRSLRLRAPTSPTSWNFPELQHCLLLEFTPIVPVYLNFGPIHMSFFSREPCHEFRRLSKKKIKFGLGVDQGLTRCKPDTGMVPQEHDDRFPSLYNGQSVQTRPQVFKLGFIVTCRPLGATTPGVPPLLCVHA